jgi:hypothetical protein
MSDENTTTAFENKCDILADVWLTYRNDEEFADFISYNDIGLPLAYVLSNEIVTKTDVAERFINETFDLLLAGLGIDEDKGWEFLDELLGDAEQ